MTSFCLAVISLPCEAASNEREEEEDKLAFVILPNYTLSLESNQKTATTERREERERERWKKLTSTAESTYSTKMPAGPAV